MSIRTCSICGAERIINEQTRRGQCPGWDETHRRIWKLIKMHEQRGRAKGYNEGLEEAIKIMKKK